MAGERDYHKEFERMPKELREAVITGSVKVFEASVRMAMMSFTGAVCTASDMMSLECQKAMAGQISIETIQPPTAWGSKQA